MSLQLKNAFLIFNPVAGQDNSEELLEEVKERLSDGLKLTVLETTPDVSAETLTQQAIDSGAELVIASGGDGTVGAVAGKLVATHIPLGVIPRGTANAFSVALGIPTRLDSPLSHVQAACEVILDGFVKYVDTAVVDTSEVKDYPMILLLGIGYEAEVVEAADRDLKDMLGPMAYILSGASKLVSADNFKTVVEVDGTEIEGLVGAITIANAAPPFSVLAHGATGDCIYDDGKLEAIGYVSQGTLSNITGMIQLFSGVLLGSSEQPGSDDGRVYGGRYKDIRVMTEPPQKVVLDGELSVSPELLQLLGAAATEDSPVAYATNYATHGRKVPNPT
eukprot:jgi/Chrzof1/10925/Cz05g17130.t1